MTLDEDKDGKGWLQNELRILLLGWDWLEKSLVGNALLGHAAFDGESSTEACMRKQGISAADGTKLTVVNTPPDWLHYAVSDPASVEHRLVTSASLCQPGPHVLLMVIPVDSLPGRERSLEAALLLLSDILWKYTMVVLTGLEKLTEPKDIAEEYGCLQNIFDKCGHRYHCLNTLQLSQDGGLQVLELLKDMVALAEVNQDQTGEAFLSTHSISEEAERRIELVNKKAEVRQREEQKECQTQKLLQTAIRDRQTPLKVMMVGARQAGKSTSGNVILGQDVFQSGLPTTHCIEREGDAVGRRVVLVDTPGWDHGSHSLPWTLKEARLYSTESTSLDEAEPNAFLLVVRCDKTFTETDKRLLQEHLTPWGRDAWQRGIVLFTCGDLLGQTAVEQHIERWPALVWLVEKCANRYHVLDNIIRTCNCKVKELTDKIEAVDLINNSQSLLQGLLRAERDKSKQRSKVKELQKKVRDLQRDYEHQEKLQEERNQRLQDGLRSCDERESVLKEKEQWMNERLIESEEKKREQDEQIEHLTQRCHEQDRVIELMRKEQVALRQSLLNQEAIKEPEDHKQYHGHQNRMESISADMDSTLQMNNNQQFIPSDGLQLDKHREVQTLNIENIFSDMDSTLQINNNQQFIPSVGLQLDKQREVKTLPLSEPEERPETPQMDRQRPDRTDQSDNMQLTEPTCDYMKLNSAVVQTVEEPPQEVTITKQHSQPQDFEPAGAAQRFEGAVVGALLGTLTGLRRGALRAALGTAIGASVGALLDAFLKASGKC